MKEKHKCTFILFLPCYTTNLPVHKQLSKRKLLCTPLSQSLQKTDATVQFFHFNRKFNYKGLTFIAGNCAGDALLKY